MDLSAVAVALYGVAPAGFVAARTAAAAEAVAAGDRALADDIRALRKPSAAAAAVNGLVRDRPELVDALLATGDGLRAASAARDRDAIRDLTSERRRLLREATSEVRASPAVLREVEETLQAAVIDTAAAEAVRGGMLVRAGGEGVVPALGASPRALPAEHDGVAREADGHPADATATTATDARVAEGRTTAPTAEDRATNGRTTAPTTDTRATDTRTTEPTAQDRARAEALTAARATAATLTAALATTTAHRAALEDERAALEHRLRDILTDLTETRTAERDLRRRLTAAERAVRAAEAAEPPEPAP